MYQKRFSLLAGFFIIAFLYSCSNVAEFDSLSVIAFTDESLVSENVTLLNDNPDPETIFFQFLEMVEAVKEMNREKLLNLTEEEADSIGKPVHDVIDNTELLSGQALRRIALPLQEIADQALGITRDDHKKLTAEVLSIITPMAGFNAARRSLKSEKIKEFLIEIHDASPEQGAGCSTLFNKTGDFVVLFERDNFAVANAVCPEGTTFFIMPGIHTLQSVKFSKKGNQWLGLDAAVMDGLNRVNEAFTGNYVDHNFAFFEIRNYRQFGIVDKRGESYRIIIREMIFRNIGDNVDGETYGAVKFLESQNIEVRESYFENVASSIRFATSRGPLKVLNNDALNPGRNFFQCDKCFGPDIHIMNNSLENTTGFGLDKLEDYINIFASEGESNSPIRVNFNRARTNGLNLSSSGSFIILGDFGGKYQEAIGNIGVNPGQVGIGAAGGNHILVQNNLMFSSLIEGISNVAYYSAKIPSHSPPCSDHKFENNRANWVCGRISVCRYGVLNRAWAHNSCGLSDEELLDNTFDDLTLTPDIWYDLSTRNKEDIRNDFFISDKNNTGSQVHSSGNAERKPESEIQQ